MKKALYKHKYIALFLVMLLSLPLMGLSCDKEQTVLQPVTLQYWGYDDRQKALDIILEDYNKTRPHVTVEYTQIDEEDYEEILLNALAENRGPDIFVIPNTYLKGYKAKIAPLEKEIQVSYINEEGSAFSESQKSMTLKKLNNDFLQIVYDTVVLDAEQEYDAEGIELPIGQKIYGLPLSIDTLALYYNTDLFANAGITEPPKTWNTFYNNVKTITKVNDNNRILQSAAGFGTSDNVKHFFDIVSVLMMQNGSIMTTKDGFTATFAQNPSTSDFLVSPGLRALEFYVGFALPYKDAYTWNEKMPDSLQAFIQGKTAMFIGYTKDREIIMKQAPKLPFDIASLPQVSGNKTINYANFDLEVVSKKSQNIDTSWDFIQFITKVDQLDKYLDIVKRPTPLKALVVNQQKDEDLEVFVSQLLTAKDWYKGYDTKEAKQVFMDMVDDVHIGKYESNQDALDNAAFMISQTLYPKE